MRALELRGPIEMRALELRGRIERKVGMAVEEVVTSDDDTFPICIASDSEGACFLIYREDDWRLLAAVCRGLEKDLALGQSFRLLAERIEHDAG